MQVYIHLVLILYMYFFLILVIQVGFFSMEYPRIEGIVTPVDVNVFGETVTDLEFIYTQGT